MVAPADRNLLFGVRALQAGHLDAARFAEACSLWAGQPHAPLAEVLVARGWLTPEQRDEIDRQLNPPEATPPAEVAESDLPLDLTIDEAVERAYPTELTDVTACLERELSVLAECEKELTPYLYIRLRDRLRAGGRRCVYLDGRSGQQDSRSVIVLGPIAGMVAQMREVVSGAVERRIVVLPHLDLLTGGMSELTREARDVLTLLHENPEITWLAFRDPLVELPRLVLRFFPQRFTVGRVEPSRLRHLVTQRESRKFGLPFDAEVLARHLEGLHAAAIRKVLTAMQREDYPANPRPVFEQLAHWRGQRGQSS